MLTLDAARKTFNRGLSTEKVALDGLDLYLEKGDFAIVIGSNGAGKSTMLNALAGAFSLDSGKITVAGQDITNLPAYKRASFIARVFQDPMKGTASGMTVAENLLLAELRGKRRGLRNALTPARLAHYRERLSILGLGLENRLDTRVDLLSGGQRQSVSLVMATLNNPQILLLDEHTAALDPRTADLVMSATVKAVGAFGLTTLMVTHNMQHAIDYGNRIIMLQDGRVKVEINDKTSRDLNVAELVRLFGQGDDRILLGR